MSVLSFHAFTDGLDEWANTRAEADHIINVWRKDGCTNLRIYEEVYDEDDLEMIREDCVFSEGGFPW